MKNNHFFNLINPEKILLKKGNIYKFKLNQTFFKNGIRDFYFSDIKVNETKGWKLKKRCTVCIVVKGKIKFSFMDKKKIKNSKTLSAVQKKIIIIKKNIKFKFSNNDTITSSLISFLNEKF